MRKNASTHNTTHLGNRPDGNAQRPRRAVDASGHVRVPIVVPIFFACEFLDCADILQSFSHFSRGGVELKSDENESSANHEEDERPNARAHAEHDDIAAGDSLPGRNSSRNASEEDACNCPEGAESVANPAPDLIETVKNLVLATDLIALFLAIHLIPVLLILVVILRVLAIDASFNVRDATVSIKSCNILAVAFALV